MSEARKILVLGASGLIGRFVTDDLRARGFHVVGIARRFAASQKASALDLEKPVMSLDAGVLAALPVQLPAAASATPFQPVDVEDIAATIAWLAGRDAGDKTADAVVWDLMQPQPVTLGGVIEQFRSRFGTADTPRIALSGFMLDLGARLGDLANWLCWLPPLRTPA